MFATRIIGIILAAIGLLITIRPDWFGPSLDGLSLPVMSMNSSSVEFEEA